MHPSRSVSVLLDDQLVVFINGDASPEDVGKASAGDGEVYFFRDLVFFGDLIGMSKCTKSFVLLVSITSHSVLALTT